MNTFRSYNYINKTDAYKWINPDKDGTYKSNHINSPIEWQLLAINQLENYLNAHSGIITVKIEMVAEQFITKELIFQNEQDEKLENRIRL